MLAPVRNCVGKLVLCICNRLYWEFPFILSNIIASTKYAFYLNFARADPRENAESHTVSRASGCSNEKV